ncbi:MAG: class I SAM-dependent methyltransferase [Bacteroidia bacterium]
MKKFWNYKFSDNEDFIETFDELPLWSASFGLLLLKHVQLKANLNVLDIGSGAGFPLFELAERLGPSCKCFGLDPWINANARAKKKIKNYEVSNVEVLEGSADKIPFDNESIDLIVSNLGINNFENPDKVFKECNRVMKPNCKLDLTTNLNGHWKEFYNIFEETFRQQNKPELIKKLIEEQEHRGTVATVSKLFTDNGFKITRHFEETFEMRFLNGTAFLNHHFIKVGWLSSWQNIIPQNEHPTLFEHLEKNLNAHARKTGGLTLSVPMAFIEGEKI